MTSRKLRPFMVLAATAVLFGGGGCVYTPYRDVTFRGDDLGTTDQAVLRVGHATREDVFARYGGQPSYRTANDRAVAYLFGTTTGCYRGLLMGPCAPYVGESPRGVADDVWLEFDEAGTLVRYERRLTSKFDNRSDRAWEAFTRSVPDEPRRPPAREPIVPTQPVPVPTQTFGVPGREPAAPYSDREAEAFAAVLRARPAGVEWPATLAAALADIGIDPGRLDHGGTQVGGASAWDHYRLNEQYTLVAVYRLYDVGDAPDRRRFDGIWIHGPGVQGP